MTEPLASDRFAVQPELNNLGHALQRCSGFGLYFARCNTVALRNDLAVALKALISKPVIELAITPENDMFIDAQLAQCLQNAPDNAVVFVYDLEKLFNLKDRDLLHELNWRREFYSRCAHPLVFWLPEFLLTELFNAAPDFIDWRSGVYEFNLSQAEQQALMASTWQEARQNFVGQMSLSEKQRWIVSLQNLLAELDGQQNSATQRNLLIRLGQLHDSLGQYGKALSCYQQALKISQDLGDKLGEGTALNNLSLIYAAKGDYDTALSYLTQALKIQQDLGDKQGEGTTLNNLSQIYAAKGDYDTALSYLTQSLEIRQDLGDKQGEGVTLNNLAATAHAKGDYDTALSYLTQALEIRQDLGDKQGEGTMLNNLSQIYDAKGDYDTALSYLTQALKIRQDLGDKKGEGTTLNNLSQIYDAKGDYDTALSYLAQALEIQQDLGDKAGECATLFNIGHIHFQNEEQQQAMAAWLTVYRMAKPMALAQALAALEDLAKQLGGEGLDFWEKQGR